MVGKHQPVTLAAMEGKFQGGTRAGVAVIGQLNVAASRLDNPIEVPDALSLSCVDCRYRTQGRHLLEVMGYC